MGNTTVYVCAYDAAGSSYCQNTTVTVNAPASGFNVSSAVQALDVERLAKTKDVTALAQGAQAIANLAAFSTNSGNTSQAVTEAVNVKASSLISSLSATANVKDPEGMRQVVSAVAGLASIMTELPPQTKANILGIGQNGIKAALSSSRPISSDTASQLVSVLATGTLGGVKATRRLLADEAAISTLSTITSSLDDVVKLLAASATPAAGYLSAGSSGLYAAVASQPGKTMDALTLKVGFK
jgi:hypothetical protein